MRKMFTFMIVFMITAMLAGCSSTEAVYEYAHYDAHFKEIQQQLVYEEQEDRTYILTFHDWTDGLDVIYTKDKSISNLAIYGNGNRANTYYSQEKGKEAYLNFNGCIVDFETDKQQDDVPCTSKQLARIAKDKKNYTAYFKRYEFNKEGIFTYCDEFLEKNKEHAVSKEKNY